MKPPPRRSDQAFKQLQKLPVQKRALGLRAIAAAEGLSEKDLVDLVLETTGAKGKDQTREVAEVWAPILGLKVDRFVDLAD